MGNKLLNRATQDAVYHKPERRDARNWGCNGGGAGRGAASQQDRFHFVSVVHITFLVSSDCRIYIARLLASRNVVRCRRDGDAVERQNTERWIIMPMMKRTSSRAVSDAKPSPCMSVDKIMRRSSSNLACCGKPLR